MTDSLHVAVFGASGGIGAALVAALAQSGKAHTIHAGARRAPESAGPVHGFAFDLEDEASIAAAAEGFAGHGPLDLAIVATGVLHADGLAPEKTWRALSAEAMERAFRVNAIGPALVGKHVLPRLARDRRSVFAALSARVGSISDNRLGGWHAYRASKAALNMLVANFAIELARTNPKAIAVALHPGTVDTGLSRPFQGGVKPDSLFPPERSAAHLLAVLDGLGPTDSGGLFAWDGARIPF